MSIAALKDHGQAILETAKDHMIAALEAAPSEGWNSIEWADAAGLLMTDASFPAVIVHHLASVLVREGRAADVGDGAVARFGKARRRIIQESGAVANAVAAPAVGPSPEPLAVTEQSIDHDTVEAVDGAEAAAKGPWSP